jgi:nuclear transport factor 2 (NTF2) superfamily protein
MLSRVDFYRESDETKIAKRYIYRKGDLRKVTEEKSSMRDTVRKNHFYKEGKQLASITYNTKDFPLNSHFYVYSGEQLDTIHTKEFGMKNGFIWFNYDSLGRNTEEFKYGLLRTPQSKKIREFHSNDSVAKVERFEYGARLQVTYFDYDETDRLTHKLDTNFDKRLITKINYIYDTNNVVIKKAFYFKGSSEVWVNQTYDYEYNKQGDWVKRIEVIDDETVRITERDIKYSLF